MASNRVLIPAKAAFKTGTATQFENFFPLWFYLTLCKKLRNLWNMTNFLVFTLIYSFSINKTPFSADKVVFFPFTFNFHMIIGSYQPSTKN